MNRDQTAWLLMFFFALFLIIVGFQGNLGTTFAILFSPAYVELQEA